MEVRAAVGLGVGVDEGSRQPWDGVQQVIFGGDGGLVGLDGGDVGVDDDLASGSQVVADADDLLADEEERRRGRRASASRFAMVARAAARDRRRRRNLMAPVFARERTAWARVG